MSYNPPLLKKIFHTSRWFFAKFWLDNSHAVQIAITGSQGKTSIRTMLYHVLSKLGTTVATDIDLDSNFNVPITAFKVKSSTHYAIFECGIDHMGEMIRHLWVISPRIVIITGISPVHTDVEHLGSFKNLIAEKQKLIEFLSPTDFAILNYDDVHVRKMADHTRAKVIFYGTNEKKCDVFANGIFLTKKGLSFKLHYLDHSISIDSRLIGRHHVYTFLATFCVYQLITNGKNPLEFPSLISDLSPLPRRMNIEGGPLETTVLNDSIRANPASMVSGLTSFSDIEYSEGRKIAIVGEMGELEFPVNEHKKIGALIPSLKIQYYIGVGPLQKICVEKAIKNGYPAKKIKAVNTTTEAAQVLARLIHKNDFLYLKGSLMKHMERITMLLDKEEVNCTVVTCPFYNHCRECKYRTTGYVKG